MSGPQRTGRRPGNPDTRGAVLAAARHRFAQDGYEGATIRAIAAEAGVDPALVHHYFGTKQALFRAAAAFPADPGQLASVLAEGTRTERVTAFVRFFFHVWEDDAGRQQLLSVLRSAMTHEDAAALLRTFVARELLGPIAEVLEVEDPHNRLPLAAAQMVGVAMLRYIVRVEPLASAPTEELVTRLVPVLELHLFGPDALGVEASEAVGATSRPSPSGA
ncbi:MAG: TetR family transcriptional regulator [Nitriliruptoraceae bacterium]